MRIVGGALRGRRLPVPRVDGLRPTSDRVREGIASALDARGALEGAVVLDLWAGTGALSFESLSRGARRAVLVERDRRLVAAIGRAADDLDLSSLVRPIALDLSDRPERCASRVVDLGPFDLVFADPPYAAVDRVAPLLAALGGANALAPGAAVVVEHATGRPPGPLEGLSTVATYRYGDTSIVLAVYEGRGQGQGQGN